MIVELKRTGAQAAVQPLLASLIGCLWVPPEQSKRTWYPGGTLPTLPRSLQEPRPFPCPAAPALPQGQVHAPLAGSFQQDCVHRALPLVLTAASCPLPTR